MRSIKIKSELKPEQATVLSLALREALSILEMPLSDLALWLQEQIEQNPALQFDEKEPSSPACTFPIDQVAAPAPSLYSYLLEQAREALSSTADLQAMEQLIGTLNDKGFLETSSASPRLIHLLQTFDPPGVGAKSLQHALLLQLARKGWQDTVAYRLIQDHYDDFIHRRDSLPYSSTELASAIQILSHLSLDPAAPFRGSSFHPQIPDVFIKPAMSGWEITLNDTLLPKFTVDTSAELSRFEPSARWVEKMVSRRGQILLAIVKIILKIQNDFFLGHTSDLHPLSFKEVASQLALNESTISRAVKEKVISCPSGIYPLRFFFPHASSNCVSHHTAKERLKALIEREDKKEPLSDQALTAALHAQGIPCARRTITKYRKSLNILSAFHRKERSFAATRRPRREKSGTKELRESARIRIS
jgi:RNA polymerase sigma-54 factor